MKNRINILIICILTLLLLVGCIFRTDENYDTTNETVADSDTPNTTQQLSAKAARNEDGTYSFELIGYDENVDYKQQLDNIDYHGDELGKYDLPTTLEGVESMVANNTWPTKFLIYVADQERRYGPFDFCLPDISMIERIGAFNYESMKVKTVNGQFLPIGLQKVLFEYKDSIIDYNYGEIGPYDYDDNLFQIDIYTPKVFESTLNKNWGKDYFTQQMENPVFTYGNKEGIETVIDSNVAPYTFVYYIIEWDGYKAYAMERYLREDINISLTDEVMDLLQLYVINEEGDLYYRVTLSQFNQNPSIEWIKNFVEGKPTSSAVTE